MLDRITKNSSRTNYIPYAKEVTVYEHRATTDDSIRILNEMEDKARQNIIKTIEIQENFINGVIVMFRESHPTQQIIYHLRFTLNSKEFFIEGAISFREWRSKNTEAHMSNFDDYAEEVIKSFLIKEYSQAIAAELVSHSEGILKF